MKDSKRTTIGRLQFTERARNCLYNAYAYRVNHTEWMQTLDEGMTEDKVQKLTESDLRSTKNCGVVTIQEIKDELAKFGLSLRR